LPHNPKVAGSNPAPATTKSFGRALSESTSGTGYQAAISPPWEVAFGLAVYGFTLCLLAASWYAFGIGRAALTLVIVFLAILRIAVVHDSIQDRIGKGAVTEVGTPLIDRQLTGDEG
jgi:hypothetical protein